MKTMKIIIWIVLLSVFGIVVYQNRQTLSINLPFSFNIYFRPELRLSYPVGNVMGFSAFVGFVIGSWMFFRLYWKKRKELKQCMDSLKELSLTASIKDGEKLESQDNRSSTSSTDIQ